LKPIDPFGDVAKLQLDDAKIDRGRAGDRCAGGMGFGILGIEGLLASRNFGECLINAVSEGMSAVAAQPLKLAIDAHDRVGKVGRGAVAGERSGGPSIAGSQQIIDPPLHRVDLSADGGKAHIGRAVRSHIATGLAPRRSRGRDGFGLGLGVGINDDRVQPLAYRKPGAACGVPGGLHAPRDGPLLRAQARVSCWLRHFHPRRQWA
jgi:hypothetical protein